MAAPVPENDRNQRPRGAPVGNHNARKHGAYARDRQVGRILPKDLARLGTLSEEILQLHAYFQVIFKHIPTGMGFNAALFSIRALSQTAIAISRLYETNFELIRMRAESREECNLWRLYQLSMNSKMVARAWARVTN